MWSIIKLKVLVEKKLKITFMITYSIAQQVKKLEVGAKELSINTILNKTSRLIRWCRLQAQC